MIGLGMRAGAYLILASEERETGSVTLPWIIGWVYRLFGKTGIAGLMAAVSLGLHVGGICRLLKIRAEERRRL
ncbi:MAG: hypothetical protein JXR37_04285 [Kiritimatiellae bacterium]|nr:hypothetical protein [Kiritimatiellia bacterium]